ncbi:hypothetical protein EVAR_82313_1 [Eumeta japonica]|uniref:Uncharacterized protein n=1 Tax=Eumeta variegata TaxID=151549 RepID=A0A4C1VZ66_EUMVA|nr:hypothetical protein EVAR_82313_1 [Eumeta japonica]
MPRAARRARRHARGVGPPRGLRKTRLGRDRSGGRRAAGGGRRAARAHARLTVSGSAPAALRDVSANDPTRMGTSSKYASVTRDVRTPAETLCIT